MPPCVRAAGGWGYPLCRAQFARPPQPTCVSGWPGHVGCSPHPRQTYTFGVFAILIAGPGAVGINRMATGIFPAADVPVISIILEYTGRSPDEVESRPVLPTERSLTAVIARRWPVRVFSFEPRVRK
ncbi:MAG: cation/multidrug efflux pump [Gemmataceae bacterium]|nr:cation/multidrug efflux pump [Gemmataceae bacterium]